jgi:murein DD-endopeptidase MepM/ murein hydrolase activator NlpD
MGWCAPLQLQVVRPDGHRLVRLRLTPAIFGVWALVFFSGVAGGAAAVAHRWRPPVVAAVAAPVVAAPSSPSPSSPSPPSPSDDQRELLDAVKLRIGEIHAEIANWHEAQASLRKDLRMRQSALADAPDAAADESLPPQAAITAQLDNLLTTVRAETKSLRGLEPFVGQVVRTLAALPLRWPVRAAVSSEFGRRRSPWSGESEFHDGIDIAAHEGTRVLAPSAGRVAFVGATPEYGNTLVLDHGNSIRTRFGHLERAMVKMGQRVERGQAVALTGNTGRSTGPHLHYEILVQGHPVNPRQYLRE